MLLAVVAGGLALIVLTMLILWYRKADRRSAICTVID
jgi:hypothetical protein